jgi:hypothetical protein
MSSVRSRRCGRNGTLVAAATASARLGAPVVRPRGRPARGR